MTSRVIKFIAMLPLCAGAFGCQNGSDTQVEPVSQSTAAVQDPTIQHCEDKGFEIKPVVDNGVVRSHLCVNANSGKKCDSWAFYREECSLED